MILISFPQFGQGRGEYANQVRGCCSPVYCVVAILVDSVEGQITVLWVGFGVVNCQQVRQRDLNIRVLLVPL